MIGIHLEEKIGHADGGIDPDIPLRRVRERPKQSFSRLIVPLSQADGPLEEFHSLLFVPGTNFFKKSPCLSILIEVLIVDHSLPDQAFFRIDKLQKL